MTSGSPSPQLSASPRDGSAGPPRLAGRVAVGVHDPAYRARWTGRLSLERLSVRPGAPPCYSLTYAPGTTVQGSAAQIARVLRERHGDEVGELHESSAVVLRGSCRMLADRIDPPDVLEVAEPGEALAFVRLLLVEAVDTAGEAERAARAELTPAVAAQLAPLLRWYARVGTALVRLLPALAAGPSPAFAGLSVPPVPRPWAVAPVAPDPLRAPSGAGA